MKQQLWFRLYNGEIEVEKVNVAKHLAWTQGKMMFLDDPFKVIVNKLERKYNVDIVNEYPYLNEIFVTATFTNENIDQVLKTFQIHTPFKYKKGKRKIVITKP